MWCSLAECFPSLMVSLCRWRPALSATFVIIGVDFRAPTPPIRSRRSRHGRFLMRFPMSNKPAAANPAFASELQAGRHWRGVAEAERSATLDAQAFDRVAVLGRKPPPSVGHHSTWLLRATCTPTTWLLAERRIPRGRLLPNNPLGA